MKLCMIACSRDGYELGKKLKESIDFAEVELVVRTKQLPEISMQQSIVDFVGERFSLVDGFIFLCATGIAVRSIAPYIEKKWRDPAVLVMDDRGSFVISLLSGHFGGGNELTKRIASLCHATPVITTATDCHGIFSIDAFAKKNGCILKGYETAKTFSSDLLNGQKKRIYSALPIDGIWPEELIKVEEEDASLADAVIDYRKRDGLLVIPSCILIGLGCKKGKTKEEMKEAISSVLEEEGILQESICKIVSIDLKKDEEGIISTAREMGIPFETFSPEELSAVEGEFSESSFVKQVTGVSNVCERSICAAGGMILRKKCAKNGITVAIGRKKGGLQF